MRGIGRLVQDRVGHAYITDNEKNVIVYSAALFRFQIIRKPLNPIVKQEYYLKNPYIFGRSECH